MGDATSPQYGLMLDINLVNKRPTWLMDGWLGRQIGTSSTAPTVAHTGVNGDFQASRRHSLVPVADISSLVMLAIVSGSAGVTVRSARSTSLIDGKGQGCVEEQQDPVHVRGGNRHNAAANMGRCLVRTSRALRQAGSTGDVAPSKIVSPYLSERKRNLMYCVSLWMKQ
ncbi:hypothetical protein L209DRAFT_756705 [Thermothelomyces heterothallicus CBS 203.75]